MRRHPKRLSIVACLITLGSLALGIGPVAAFERGCDPVQHPGCDVPRTWNYGTTGPLVSMIGDSISAIQAGSPRGTTQSQPDLFGSVNGLQGWRTQVVARGGFTITRHQQAGVGSFTKAVRSNAGAVYVELGTNDIAGINDDSSPLRTDQAAQWSRVTRAVDSALLQLGPGTCVVWQGLNQAFDSTDGGNPTFGTYNEVAWAQKFNNYLQSPSIRASYPNLHYADYTNGLDLTNPNSTMYKSLHQDPLFIHPSTDAGRQALAAFAATNLKNDCPGL